MSEPKRTEVEIRQKQQELEVSKERTWNTLQRHPEDTETLIVYNEIIAKIEALQWVLGERESRFF